MSALNLPDEVSEELSKPNAALRAKYPETMDAQNRYHSFNDTPMLVEHCDDYEWYYHGLVHRDDDKPAVVSYDLLDSDDEGTKYWCILGVAHRSNGPAVQNNSSEEYYLFGKKLIKEHFQQILDKTESTGCPLWVGWFLHYCLIQKEDVTALLDENGKWTQELPLDWVLKAWNVTEESFIENSSMRYTSLDNFFYVVRYLEAGNRIPSEWEVKDNHGR